MHDLDITQMALVGAPASRKGEIRNPVEKRCEGCREHVYLSRPMMHKGIQQAKAQGQKAIVVCKRCARPWISDVVKNGGTILGQKDVIDQEVLPELKQAQADYSNRN